MSELSSFFDRLVQRRLTFIGRQARKGGIKHDLMFRRIYRIISEQDLEGHP